MVRACLITLACTFIGFHVWCVLNGTPSLYFFRGGHLLFALVVIFFGGLQLQDQDASPLTYLNSVILLFLVGAAIFSIGYLLVEQDYILYRFPYNDALKTIDIIGGLALIAAVLEAVRRTSGIALPITGLLFVGYAIFLHGVDPLELLDHLYMTPEGIFGIPLNVSATYMVLFILFGAFVEKSGTGKLFRDFSLALAGHNSGGPAKVAVITSGMFGSVSGSSTANVMTTGSFTIPMMKQLGYKNSFSGAVEAVASTGGQILPPIMGAAAFVMAEFMGRSYLSVVVMASIPALLYFLAVFMAVHFEARRSGLKGLPKSDLPEMGRVLVERGHQFIPIVAIVVMLLSGFSAPYSGFVGCALVFPVAMLRKTTRKYVTIPIILDAITAGAKNAAPVAAVTAIAGVVIGVVTLTGLGVEFTKIVLMISQSSLIIALLLTAVAGIILGMGLPTTPAYIVQVALLVPALIKLGVVEEAAHLFAFYFAILSSITPPVAITLFAAMSLSNSKLGEISVAAFKLGATGYFVPFMFVFGPALLMIGSTLDIVLAIVTACIGVTLAAAGLHGFLLSPLLIIERFALICAAVLLTAAGIQTDLMGLGLAGSVLVFEFIRFRWFAPARRAEGRWE